MRRLSAKDLTGQSFGRWTVTGPMTRTPRQRKGDYRIHWTCRCECGTVANVDCSALTSGHSTSCGCFQVERSKAALTNHGHARVGLRTREYRAWDAMIQRCTNPSNKTFPRYGGRGVAVCQRWLTDSAHFLADMGRCPEGHQIERIDNDGNYEPSNCRWATRLEQARNKSANVRLTHNGETLCLQEWANRVGIRRETIRHRLKKGWPIEQALTVLPK